MIRSETGGDAIISTILLLLPALIPSWRFFDAVAPSPRIEIAHLGDPGETPHAWRPFCPRPQRVSLAAMVWRLVWNPRWNETLFLVSCAERLVSNPTDHSRQEIFARIRADLVGAAEEGGDQAAPPEFFQFRLVFVSRKETRLEKEVWYVSAVERVIVDGRAL